MLLPSLALAFLAASTPTDWPRIRPGLELAFPRDHGAHPEYAIEWWYLTGNLESDAGRRFGFQFTVFRTATSPVPAEAGESPDRARQILAGHLAVTDVDSGRTVFAERLRRAGGALARASESDLDVFVENWSLTRDPADRLTLVAADAAQEIGLAFELVPRKPLVLHGDGGYSSKGSDPGNASAYTSWTRLATSGTLTLGGEELRVTGESWFDHEYGSSVLEEGVVGWDWFGLQLGDGRELMLFVLRREDGTRTSASAATLVDRRGVARELAPEAFELRSLDTWTSPRTGAVYPAGWTIAIPGEQLELTLQPLVDDAEIEAGGSTGTAYWEGPVEIQGSVAGRGYAELTGYAGSMQGRI